MKKITVILMLTMLMSVCAFSASKDKSNPKDNVQKKSRQNETLIKAIAKTPYLYGKTMARNQANIQKQLGYHRKPKLPKSLRQF
jgi:PBP1b-binding outer membrane lipoprotein LpoB